MFVDGNSENNANEMSNPGEKKVGFGGTGRKRFSRRTGKRRFEQENRAFGESTVTVKIVPMMSAARNTGVKTEIFVGISISAFVGILGAGIFANTNRVSTPFNFNGFRTDIFETHRAVFAAANAVIDKGSFIFEAKRRTVVIKMRMSRVGVARVKGDAHSVKMKIVA